MNQQREAYIGLDVHKDSITIGIAECGRDGEVRCHGTIKGDLNNLTKTIDRTYALTKEKEAATGHCKKRSCRCPEHAA